MNWRAGMEMSSGLLTPKRPAIRERMGRTSGGFLDSRTWGVSDSFFFGVPLPVADIQEFEKAKGKQRENEW